MELIFLGTSSGAPTRARNLSATAIKIKNSKNWSLIDCGEGTQQQILKTKLSLLRLKTICISHIHGDHCFGLPGLLASASMNGRKEPLNLIAPIQVKLFLDNIQKTLQLDLSFKINFIAIETLSNHFCDCDFNISITELSHRVPSFAFTFTEKNIQSNIDTTKLIAAGILPGPSWGKLQQGENVILENGQTINSDTFLQPRRKARSIVICGDNDSPELLKTITPKADVIVHEATFTEKTLKKVGPIAQHTSARQIAQFAQQIQLKNLVLTHFSGRYTMSNKSPSINDIKNEALQYYSGNLYLANDFDSYQLDKQGNLFIL
ncbi:MAG: ribonuclease Z [Pseudomonadota bacterium]